MGEHIADWQAAPIGASRTVAGTVNAALVSYYQSSAFNKVRQRRRLGAFLIVCELLHTGDMEAGLDSSHLSTDPFKAPAWPPALGFCLH
jgi:hypothetical protein